jgi:CDP-glycerol glycerophosphotransferase
MPRVSVVVPVYEVESYLATCLQSLARQTFRDLEVLMVDDGSTDRSVTIAERFAESDPRFRLLRQENGGLGRARNTGLAAASGEFVTFVDSDDVVPDGAYARMVRSLDETGSDIATGNVQRLTRQGTSQAQFLARTFARNRPRTHVTKFRALLADRTAWNKLWRRSFWDELGAAFPEGVIHEDIPVTLPAHLAAARVDVLAAPVYQWRLREDGALSITQRRLEERVLRDRLAAVEAVRSHFAEHAPRKLCRWYDASLLADDLRLHLVILDQADAEYRRTFIEGAQRILDCVSPRMLAGLRAIDRLKWHLVARGLDEELVEVLRFEHENVAEARPIRRNGRFYGDYPFRTDRKLGLPSSAFRLGRRDQELSLAASIEALERDGDRLRLRGRAHVTGLDAPDSRMQRTTALALRPGRWQSLRLRTSTARLPTAATYRPDLAGERDLSWSGFETTLDLCALCGRRGWREGRWKVFLHTRAGIVHRRRGQFQLDSPELIGAVDVPAPAGISARATISTDGTVTLDVRKRWARLDGRPYVADGALTIPLEVRAALGPAPRLRLKRRSDAVDLTYPILEAAARGPARFVAYVPLADLDGTPLSLESRASGNESGDEMWDLCIDGTGPAMAVGLPDPLSGGAWTSQAHEMSLLRTRRGDAALVTHRPAVVVELGSLLARERITAPASLQPLPAEAAA